MPPFDDPRPVEPPTQLAAEVQRLRFIADASAEFIEEVAHFAPGRLGVRARDLLVELGAWVPTVEADARPDPIVAKLRVLSERVGCALSPPGEGGIADELAAIADEVEQR